MFFGVNGSLARTTTGYLLEAMVEASLTAKNHGFQRLLFLSYSRGLITAFNTKRAPDWQDVSRLLDLNFLVQQGLLCKMILVPQLLFNTLCDVAKRATQMPIKHCWYLVFL